MMLRLNLLLVLAVFASALYLVHIEYALRKLYSTQDAARAQTQSLLEERRTLLRQRDQATPQNIEQMARQQLHMQFPAAANTVYRADAVVQSSNPQASQSAP